MRLVALWFVGAQCLLHRPGTSVARRVALRESADSLLEEADRLRKEIAEEEAGLAAAAPPAAKAEGSRRLRVTLPISKPDWTVDETECDFPSVLPGESELICFDVAVPCGLVLEEVDGRIVVADTLENSTSRAAGLRAGDVLRTTSAVRQQMEMPTWQILGGGIGRPRPFRFILGADLAGPPPRTFEDVLQAVGSNSGDEERRPALLVIERATSESIGDGEEEAATS